VPYRAAGILMALAGLVAVVGLVIVGIDVYAAKERGPRWQRRLLGAGLAVLGALGLYALRPKPPVRSCYMQLPQEHSISYDVRQRANLLEKMVLDKKIEAATAEKTLAGIEQDLARLPDDERLKHMMPGREATQAIANRGAARAVLLRIKARLEAGPLGETSEWQRLAETWKEAERIAASKPYSYPFDEAGQKTLLLRLAQAGRDADTLLKAELLSAPEAALLQKESEALVERVRRFRPTELRNAECYKPMVFFPARESAARLAERLPLLEKMAAAGRVQPAALRKVLAAVERDLAALDRESDLQQLDAAERAAAEQTREAVKAEVEKLRKLLAGETSHR
jgi:hypothetical protein